MFSLPPLPRQHGRLLTQTTPVREKSYPSEESMKRPALCPMLAALPAETPARLLAILRRS